MTYDDQRWRDSYDAWKLASPYDDWEEPEECDHEEYEVDWEGRATCDYCRAHWWLTTDQLIAHQEAEARWMEEYYRAQRREQSRFWRVVDWLCAIPARIRQQFKRKATIQVTDDEIPF